MDGSMETKNECFQSLGYIISVFLKLVFIVLSHILQKCEPRGEAFSGKRKAKMSFKLH